jgi:hypothetical protein
LIVIVVIAVIIVIRRCAIDWGISDSRYERVRPVERGIVASVILSEALSE